jgi:O-antigen polymerase
MKAIVLILINTLLIVLFSLLSSADIPGLIDSTQTGRFIIFSYAVCALLILFLLSLDLAESRYKINLPDISMFALFAYISINRYILQSESSFSMRYYELMGLAIIYIILRQSGAKIYQRLLIAVILGGIIQATYGNLQLFKYFPSNHNAFNMTGSFFNPGPFAGYLVSVFPAALGVYFFKNELEVKGSLLNRAAEYIPLIGIFSIILVLPASQSRAAWVAAVISSIFLAFYKYNVAMVINRYLNSRFKKALAIVIASGILLIGMAALYLFKKDSGNGRLLIWKTTINMIKDNPLTGLGFDRFKTRYMDYQADYFRSHSDSGESSLADNVTYAFNEFLQFFSENGSAGALILLLILVLLFRAKSEKTDPVLFIAKASLLSVMVFSMFSYPAHILPIKLNCVFYLAIISGFYLKPVIVISIIKRNQAFATVLKICILLVSITAVYFTAKNIAMYYQGSKNWYTAFLTYRSGKYVESVNYFSVAYPVLSKNGTFLMQYGKALSLSENHQKAIPVLRKAQFSENSTFIQTALGDSYKALKQYEQAENAYVLASYMTPGKIYPKYLLAKLYDETGQEEKAIELAKQLLTQNVKIESQAVSEIKMEMKAIIDQ